MARIPKIIRDSVIERDNGICRLCGRQAVDIHHLQFKSLQGNNTSFNLICLCRKHHDLAHSHQHKYFNILFESQKKLYPKLEKEMLKK